MTPAQQKISDFSVIYWEGLKAEQADPGLAIMERAIV